MARNTGLEAQSTPDFQSIGSDLESSSADELDAQILNQAATRRVQVAKGLGFLGLFAAAMIFATSPQSGLLKVNKKPRLSSLTAADEVTSGGPISVAGAAFCVDIQAETTDAQLWTCFSGNNNQQFSLLPSSCDESSGKLARLMWMSNRAGMTSNGAKKCLAPAAGTNDLEVTDCAQAPVFAIPPTRQGQIKLNSDQTKCLHVITSPAEGGKISVADCIEANMTLNTWNLSATPAYIVGVIKVDNKCIQAGAAARSPATLADCDESQEQKWIFPEGGRIGLIRSQVDSNLCLDIVDAKLESGNALQVYNCQDGGHKAQLFKIPAVTDTNGGTCAVGYDQTLCLEDVNGQATLGACTDATATCKTEHDCNLFVVPTTTTTTVTSDVPCTPIAYALPDGEYKIRSKLNTKLVTAENGGTDIETNLGLLDYIPGRAWARFTSATPAGGIATTFENMHATGQFINVAGGSAEAGANVQLYNNAGSTDSQWNVFICSGENATTDGVLLRSANTGINGITPTYMSVEEGSTNIATSTRSGTSRSKWLMEPAEEDAMLVAAAAPIGLAVITNVQTGQLLTVQEENGVPNVISSSGTGSDTTSHWNINAVIGGAANVVNIQSVYTAGQYVSIDGTTSGANIVLVNGNTATSTQWEAFNLAGSGRLLTAGSAPLVFKAKGTEPALYLGSPFGTNVVANTDYIHQTSQWTVETGLTASPVVPVTPGDYRFEVVGVGGAPSKYLKPNTNIDGGNVIGAPTEESATWTVAAAGGTAPANSFTIKHDAQQRYLSHGSSTVGGQNVVATSAAGIGTTWQFVRHDNAPGLSHLAIRSSDGPIFLTVDPASTNAETTSDSQATIFNLVLVESHTNVSGHVDIDNIMFASLSGNAEMETSITAAIVASLADTTANPRVNASSTSVEYSEVPAAPAVPVPVAARRMSTAGSTRATFTILVAPNDKVQIYQDITASSAPNSDFLTSLNVGINAIPFITNITQGNAAVTLGDMAVDQEQCGAILCPSGMVCDTATDPTAPTCKCGAIQCGAAETCDVSDSSGARCMCGANDACGCSETCSGSPLQCMCGSSVCGEEETCDGSVVPSVCKCGSAPDCGAATCTQLFLQDIPNYPKVCMCGEDMCAAGETCVTTGSASACHCGAAPCSDGQRCDASGVSPMCVAASAALGVQCGTQTCKVGETCTAGVCKCGPLDSCQIGEICAQPSPGQPLRCMCGSAICEGEEVCTLDNTTNASASAVCMCGANQVCTDAQTCTTQPAQTIPTCTASSAGETCGATTCPANEICDGGVCKCGSADSAATCDVNSRCDQSTAMSDFTCMCGAEFGCPLGTTCDYTATPAPVCKCGTGPTALTCGAGETCSEGSCRCGTGPACGANEVCDTSGETPICKCGSAACGTGEQCEAAAGEAGSFVCKCGVHQSCGSQGECVNDVCSCGSGLDPCKLGETCAPSTSASGSLQCQCGPTPGMFCAANHTCDTSDPENHVCKCGTQPACQNNDHCLAESSVLSCRCPTGPGTNPCSPTETCVQREDSTFGCQCGSTTPAQFCELPTSCNANHACQA